MRKKSHIITTIICLSICAVLLIAACLIGYDFNSVKVGKGEGTNAEVTTIKEVGSLIDTLFLRSPVSPRAASDGDEKEKEFTTMTARVTSSSYLSKEYENSTFSTTTVQRDILYAVTQDDLYIHTEFTVTSDAKLWISDNEDDDDDSKEYSDVAADFEIYMSAERLLIRINSITMAYNGKSSYDYERVIGEWGDFSDDMQTGIKMASSLTSINKGIYDILTLISDYISEYPDLGFSKKGVSYMMKSDTFKSFAGRLMENAGSSTEYLDEDFSGALEFDLDNPREPVISLDFKSSYENESGGSDKTLSEVYVAETSVFEFSKINNTAIYGYDDIDALSAKDYIELMEETA